MLSPWKNASLVVMAASTFLCAVPGNAAVRKDPPASIHGAVYVPSDAYNAPQLWKDFSLEETRRDFGYAREIHVNALRVWASYEFWWMDPLKFQNELDQMLGIFTTAKSLQGTVPLTLGSNRIEVAEQFIPLGLDVIQYHMNFPPTTAALVEMTKSALALGEKTGLPVWLTEWQRVRSSGSGFGKEKISGAERATDYASLAPTVRAYPVGSFFWCLMVKRAYLRGQRLNGTVNGLFWPDGSVTSLKDAQAVADDPSPSAAFKERPFPASYGTEAMR